MKRLILAAFLAVSAASVLINDGHEDAIYTETGPEAITYSDVAATMSEVFGQPIEHVDLTPEQWYEHILKMNVPEPVARTSMSFVKATLAGEFGILTDDYERITGRKPRTFKQLLADNRDKYLQMFG